MAKPCCSEIRAGRQKTQWLRAREKPMQQILPVGSERWAAAYRKLLLMAVCMMGSFMTGDNQAS